MSTQPIHPLNIRKKSLWTMVVSFHQMYIFFQKIKVSKELYQHGILKLEIQFWNVTNPFSSVYHSNYVIPHRKLLNTWPSMLYNNTVHECLYNNTVHECNPINRCYGIRNSGPTIFGERTCIMKGVINSDWHLDLQYWETVCECLMCTVYFPWRFQFLPIYQFISNFTFKCTSSSLAFIISKIICGQMIFSWS